MKAKAKRMGAIATLVLSTLMVAILFQNCGEIPDYPVDLPSQPPQDEAGDNNGSGGTDPDPDTPPVAGGGTHVVGLLSAVTINDIPVKKFTEASIGQSIVLRFTPNMLKLAELGVIPPMPGLAGPIIQPAAYFSLLVSGSGGVGALPLDYTWPTAATYPEAMVNGEWIVAEKPQRISLTVQREKVPADGSNRSYNISPPRGGQTLRVLYSYAPLDFTGVDFSQMSLDEVTELVLSNTYSNSQDFFYEIVDFNFEIKSP